MFTVRTSKPGSGNKCYITTGKGGWSRCIQGKPTDSQCNVLANCVGYASGRFAEIYNEIKKTTGMKYAALNCNAENWIERAKSLGLQVGQTPKPGAIMCWQKGATLHSDDGAGHVCIVEKVYSDNSVYTSESGYGSSAFWNATRNNNNGRWGAGSGYTFRGFIYNPAVEDVPPSPAPRKYKVGDALIFTGRLYANSYGGGAGQTRSNLKCTITKVSTDVKATKPYNINNGLGWVAEADLKPITPTPTPTPTQFKVGDWVRIVGKGNGAADGSANTAYGIGWKKQILKIYTGYKYPYRVGSTSSTIGFYQASALKKL